MVIDGYLVLLLVHILMFGFWLGSDMGVFFCDSQMTRDDLDIEERLRVRSIRYKIDLGPRTCLVLMLAIGFTLGPRYGSPFTGGSLVAIWIACLSWLALVWAVRLNWGTPLGERLSRFDRKVWWTVGGTMIALGGYALANDVLSENIIVPKWLALKWMIFGLICWNGIWIMRSADHWYPLIEMARRGGAERVRAEPLMKKTRFWCGTSAVVLWFWVVVVGFLGTVKPIQ